MLHYCLTGKNSSWFIGEKEKVAYKEKSKEGKEEKGSVFGEEGKTSYDTSSQKKTWFIVEEKTKVAEH